MELNTLTNKALVGIHNGLNPDNPLKNWKGKKEVLIDRIELLRENVSEEPEDDVTSKVTEAKPAADAKPKETGKAKEGRTIRAAAIELLCAIDYHENRDEKPSDENRVEETDKKARSVGIAYDQILERIFDEFPDCKTTVACLRWYSVKIRVEELGYEDLRLPQRRPRAKSKRA